MSETKLEAPTVEQLAHCASCQGKACAHLRQDLEDSCKVQKCVLQVLNFRTALLRKILADGRLEQSELRTQIEEECR